MVTRFHDRKHAGEMLAAGLMPYRAAPDCAVIALPRGGVVVGAEIARALDLPLETLIVRKLGVPWQPELAMGAIAEGGFEVLDRELIRRLGISPAEVAEVREMEQRELERRQTAYRGGREFLDCPSTAILTDDGIATGSTMEVAIEALRERGAERIVLAVPVSAPDTLSRLRQRVEEVTCLLEPAPFIAIGSWYADFAPVSDSTVHRHLAAGHKIAAE
ncbi:MAG: phosphoribosyltransferase family protein [Bryobacteraceae bacterium]